MILIFSFLMFRKNTIACHKKPALQNMTPTHWLANQSALILFHIKGFDFADFVDFADFTVFAKKFQRFPKPHKTAPKVVSCDPMVV